MDATTHELTMETVAEGLRFPEGPVAMKDGSVLFVEIEGKTLRRVSPGDGTPATVAQLEGGPNGIAIGPDGMAYVCNNGGLYDFTTLPQDIFGNAGVTIPAPEPSARHSGGWIERVDLATGDSERLWGRGTDRGPALIAPDDIVFDAEGGYYFTDTGKNSPAGLQNGAVYYAAPGAGALVRVADIPMPNGIGLSPEGDTLYVADTIFGRLWALALEGPGQAKPGLLPGMPGRVLAALPGMQWVDSLKVQADGRVCLGTLLTGGITIVDPATAPANPVEGMGANCAMERVTVPDMFTTNLCFGGKDMRQVWITASGTGKLLTAEWPSAGLPLAFSA